MRYLTDLDFIDSVNRMRIDQQITLLRQAGREDKAHALAKEHYIVGGNNSRMLTSAYGWVLHARIRDGSHYFHSNVTMDDYKQWLDEFQVLFPKVEDNEINAYLLRVAIKQCNSANWFLGFLHWFGLERLTEKDNLPYIIANKESYLSTSEQYFNAIAYQLAHVQQQADADLLNWAKKMLDLGLQKHPDSEHLQYCKALQLVQMGKAKEGIHSFNCIAEQKSDRYWIRIQMGHLLLVAGNVEAAKSQFQQAIEMGMSYDKSRIYFFDLRILLSKLLLNYPVKVLGEMLVYGHYYSECLKYNNAVADHLLDINEQWNNDKRDRHLMEMEERFAEFREIWGLDDD